MKTDSLAKQEHVVEKQIKEVENDQKRNLKASIQSFQKSLNEPVEESKLEKHPFAEGNVKYLPISYLQMGLDVFFLGIWSTTNFKWERVLNEMVASIDVSVYHPFAEMWITRNGGAARSIMVDKIPNEQKKQMTKQEINQWALDLNNKKGKALEMGGFAALKSDAFKNAVISLGQYFGRDVNREFVDQMREWITSASDQIKQRSAVLSTLMEYMPEGSEAQNLRSEIVMSEEAGTNTTEMYARKIKQVTDYFINNETDGETLEKMVSDLKSRNLPIPKNLLQYSKQTGEQMESNKEKEEE